MQVVILDDSKTIRQIIKLYLDDLDLDESEIFSFENGRHALDHIKKYGADLVFSDINMPEMSGQEFAKELFEFRPDLQKSLYVITGDESDNALKEMKELGAKHFLKKPINEKHFEHFIKKQIEKIRLQVYT